MSGAASFVGNIPEHYDNGLGPVIFIDYARDMAREVAALKPHRVLETAAGTGIVTRALRDALAGDAVLTATDLNPPMLDIARSKFRAGEQVNVQPADATALPFPDASFDAVVSQFGLMFFPDKDKSFREVLRVLAPGGHYCFSVWDAQRYNSYARIAQDATERLIPSNPPKFWQVPFSCAPIDPVKEAVLAAGFTDLTVSVRSREKRIADPARFARGIAYGNPSADLVRAAGGDPEHIVGAVLGELERRYGDKPMPLQAIFYRARKPG